MKIKKYIKTGSNKYKIILENDKSIILYEDVILKYELLLKKEISDLDAALAEWAAQFDQGLTLKP